jgi:GTP-binding protein
MGALTEMLSKRQAQMTNMHKDDQENVRLEFRIPTKGLIGFRGAFMTATRGLGIMNTEFIGYEPWRGDTTPTRGNGVLVSSEAGEVVAYGLANAQGRGLTFVDPGTQVYEGMIVGTHQRKQDITVNICKEKKKTNIRSSTSDIAVKLTPPVILSLEQAIDFINQDELVEITPESIRLRKKILTETQRLRELHREQRRQAEFESE